MKSNTWITYAAASVFLGWVAIASAGEPASQPGEAGWPQWRGPNRDGLCDGLPQSMDDLKLAWKTEMASVMA